MQVRILPPSFALITNGIVMITSILYKKVIEYLFWENQSIRNKVIYLTLFSGLLLISSSQIGGVAKQESEEALDEYNVETKAVNKTAFYCQLLNECCFIIVFSIENANFRNLLKIIWSRKFLNDDIKIL